MRMRRVCVYTRTCVWEGCVWQWATVVGRVYSRIPAWIRAESLRFRVSPSVHASTTLTWSRLDLTYVPAPPFHSSGFSPTH